MAEQAKEQTAPVPPQDLDAEESVLGAILLNANILDLVTEELSATDFYRASHSRIYSVCVEMYSASEPVDVITVSADLERRGWLKDVGGRERIHELAEIVPAVGNAPHYAAIVREMATLRALTTGGEKIQQLGRERGAPTPELVERAEQIVFDLAQRRSRREFIEVGETLAETFRRLEALNEGTAADIGVPSGYVPLDRLTSGFQPGNLIVVAARPSMGKSALALGVVEHVSIKLGKPVALFTLEMSRWEVTHRLLSSRAHVEAQRLRDGKLDRDQWGRLMSAFGEIKTAPLLIDDSGLLTALEIRSKARRLKMRNPDLALVVVDYLQLLSSGTKFESRVQEVSQITRALKVLAGDLEVPVIAMSQLSRGPEQRHDRRPILSDLRESGAIEQDADLVLFLYRDEYYNPESAAEDGTEGVCEVNVAKQRNGPTGIVKLAFVKRFASFSELA